MTFSSSDTLGALSTYMHVTSGCKRNLLESARLRADAGVSMTPSISVHTSGVFVRSLRYAGKNRVPFFIAKVVIRSCF